jgi:hypothetical protein
MTGTGPRQRAVIAVSFGVQAVLIAAAFAAFARPAAADHASPAFPELPVPAVLGMQSVTVDVAGQTGYAAFPLQGTEPSFTVPAGEDVSVTVTITNPGMTWTPTASVAVGYPAGGGQQVLWETGALPAGQTTFTITVPAADLDPSGNTLLDMTETAGKGIPFASPIADIVTG